MDDLRMLWLLTTSADFGWIVIVLLVVAMVMVILCQRDWIEKDKHQ